MKYNNQLFGENNLFYYLSLSAISDPVSIENEVEENRKKEDSKSDDMTNTISKQTGAESTTINYFFFPATKRVTPLFSWEMAS